MSSYHIADTTALGKPGVSDSTLLHFLGCRDPGPGNPRSALRVSVLVVEGTSPTAETRTKPPDRNPTFPSTYGSTYRNNVAASETYGTMVTGFLSAKIE